MPNLGKHTLLARLGTTGPILLLACGESGQNSGARPCPFGFSYDTGNKIFHFKTLVF
jgi:hypothetical protein